MNVVPKDPYLEVYPDTLQAIRQEFNLHKPGDIEDMIRSFEDWIEKQSHFTKKDFSKHFLETSIILAKGSLERAKKGLEKLCTLKTLIPNFFSKHDAKKDFVHLWDYAIPLYLPKMTKDNYRVFITKVMRAEIHTAVFFDYYNLVSLMCEYLKAHDYTQGFAVVLDLRGINILHYVMSLNLVDLRHLAAVLMEGYGIRIKGIHIVSESKAIDVLVTILKQALSQKLSGRIKVYKTVEPLHNDIPKDILPEDLGGDERPLKVLYDTMLDNFSTKENVEYFKDICQPGINEDYRQTVKFNNDMLGMPGSFRSLQVD